MIRNLAKAKVWVGYYYVLCGKLIFAQGIVIRMSTSHFENVKKELETYNLFVLSYHAKI